MSSARIGVAPGRPCAWSAAHWLTKQPRRSDQARITQPEPPASAFAIAVNWARQAMTLPKSRSSAWASPAGGSSSPVGGSSPCPPSASSYRTAHTSGNDSFAIGAALARSIEDGLDDFWRRGKGRAARKRGRRIVFDRELNLARGLLADNVGNHEQCHVNSGGYAGGGIEFAVDRQARVRWHDTEPREQIARLPMPAGAAARKQSGGCQ